MTSSSITIQWGAVDCIHRNGDITGYSVRYGVQGTSEGDWTVQMVSGDSGGGMYQISGLQSSTNYSIEVAAVNDIGTGVYSTDVFQSTQSTCVCYNLVIPHILNFILSPVRASGLSITTATIITLSWNVPSGSVVDSYNVMWQRDTSGDCPDEDVGSTTLTGGTTSYNIMGLAGVSSYSITVTAINAGGSMVSDTVTVMTGGAGNVLKRTGEVIIVVKVHEYVIKIL